MNKQMNNSVFFPRKTIGMLLITAGILGGLSGCQSYQREDAQMAQMDRLIAQQERALDIIARLTETTQQPVSAPAPVSMPVAAVEAVPANNPSIANPPLTGRLRSVGSDTLDRLMDIWQLKFRQQYPQVAFNHQGHGSSTAIPALIEGKADFGPMSRKIKETEVAKFKEKFGYEPVQLRVAVDAVGVYVHPENPLSSQGLTFEQLDTIFSKTLLRGGKAVTTWGDLGLVGAWANAPIHVYSRNSASGTYAFFRDTVLTSKGEYKDNCTFLTGSEELISAIANDRFGIGYSGIGYKNESVAVVPLSEKSQTNVFPPEMQYAYSGEYPLSRFLFLAVNKDPAAPMDSIARAFIEYIFSEDGQKQVTNDGFFPVSSKIISEEKATLGM